VNTLAIDIGGTKFSLALFEEERITQRMTRPTDREGGPAWMLKQIEEVARGWQFERCGVGFGGPVEFSRRRVALSTHVGGWSDFPLAQRLEELLRVPVAVDNDANVGALGEARYGAARGAQESGALPLFYMTLSTGIGGGIVLDDGSLYRGADSWAGEIGHITLHPDGPECLCGARGCFERMCSGLWLERDHGKPARELLQDPEFVSRYVVDLAQGLKAAVMLLNPARIVIGGGIAQAGERLFTPLRAELRRQVTNWSRARVDVVPAALGADSVLWGALALARDISG
jgi:glucokinase